HHAQFEADEIDQGMSNLLVPFRGASSRALQTNDRFQPLRHGFWIGGLAQETERTPTARSFPEVREGGCDRPQRFEFERSVADQVDVDAREADFQVAGKQAFPRFAWRDGDGAHLNLHAPAQVFNADTTLGEFFDQNVVARYMIIVDDKGFGLS